MRRSRTLTMSERWDLGLLLALFVVGLLLAAVFWRTGAIGNFWAMAFKGHGAAGHGEMPGAKRIDPNQLAEANEPSLQSMGMPIFVADGDGVDGGGLMPPALVGPGVAPDARKEAEVRWYKGKEYKYVKTLRMRVTAYSADEKCCWPFDGTTTASGLSVKTNSGKLVAADTSIIAFHDLVSVTGYNGGQPVPVLDRGGAIKGQRVDVLLPSFDQAKAWGARMIDVKVYAPVE